MEEYEKYFKNIISKSWLGQKKLTNKITSSIVKEIYVEEPYKDKFILLGKSDEYFFILEYFPSEDFSYSNILLNTQFNDLLELYKDKDCLLKGNTPDDFLKTVVLKKKLEQSLSIKTKTTKTFKI
jgi:hypothetical protein